MSTDYKKIEAKIKKAVIHAKSQVKPNLTQIAKDFEVPYRRFYERYHGVPSKCDRPGANKAMNPTQEKALAQYVNDVAEMGGSVLLHQMQETANYIHHNGRIDDSPRQAAQKAKEPRLGKHWTGRFVKRCADLNVVIQKPLDVKRHKAHNPDKIRDYFERLHAIIEGVHPKNIWNMDEIGFQIGMGGQRKVVTADTSKVKNHYIASHSDRQSLTITEAINAAGDVIPPMIIFQGSIIQAQHARNGLPDSTLFVPSDSSFTTDLITFRWLQHFDARTRNFMHGEERVLILDGHGSHRTWEFVTYARDHNIIIVELPPHLTHLLQPLDLTVFNPYKHYHHRQVNEKNDLGCDHYNMAEFLAGLVTVRKQTFKDTTIKHAFRDAGIVPPDRDFVLRKMEECNRNKATEVTPSTGSVASRASTPLAEASSSAQPVMQVTPTKPKQFVKMKDDMSRMDMGEEQWAVLHDKFQRGSVAMALKAGRIEEEWANWRKYNKEKDSRQNHGQKHLSRGVPVDMATLRRIDARQMAEEPLVQKRREWLKEREDILDARRDTSQIWSQMAQATTKRRAIVGLKNDKGKDRQM